MRQVLVTGANRGVGLELVRQSVARGDHVVATYRDEALSGELLGLEKVEPDGLMTVRMDVADYKSIEACFYKVLGVVDGLEILFNNAGVGAESRGMGGPEMHNVLGSLDGDSMLKVYKINAIAPILVVQRFLELLQAGREPRVVNISSIMGSLEAVPTLGSYSYSGSKAALNMMNRSLAADLLPRGIISILMHPGWVRTDMGGPDATVTPEDSARGILEITDNLTVRDVGRFYDWTGAELPW